MATYGWGSGTSVAEGLSDEGYKFEFFEAVRLLERMYPDRTPVGTGLDPNDEAVLFRTDGNQSFAPSDVVDVQLADDGQPAEVTVSFMSLTGTEGPLPEPYSELLQRRVQRGDTAMRDFFDLLTHRLVALLYRSRKRHHVGMESSSPNESTVARYLRSIAGLGLSSLTERTSIPDHALLRYADLLNQHPSSVHGLEVLLEDYFDIDVSAEPLVGRWIELDQDQQTKIGPLGQNQVLGQSAVLGTRAWDQEGRVQIHLRTTRTDEYLRFLPGRSGHRALVDLSRLYLARGVDFDLDLRIPGTEIPLTPIGSLLGPRLGRDACLGVPRDPKTTSIQPRTFPPTLETLRIRIFSMLGPDQLRAVIENLPRLEVEGDTHVVRQGRSAEAFYVVVRGGAEEVYQSPDSDESTVLASLEPGDVFGVESTIRGRTYRGSLVTSMSTTLLEVTSDQLEALVEQYPEVERAIEGHYLDSGSWGEAEGETARLAQQLARTTEAGFSTLTLPQWRAVLRSGRIMSTERGTELLRLSEEQDALVILVEGAVVKQVEGTRYSRPGAMLNARSLLLRESTADVLQTDVDSQVLRLRRTTLRRLIQKYSFVEDALRIYLHDSMSS